MRKKNWFTEYVLGSEEKTRTGSPVGNTPFQRFLHTFASLNLKLVFKEQFINEVLRQRGGGGTSRKGEFNKK